MVTGSWHAARPCRLHGGGTGAEHMSPSPLSSGIPCAAMQVVGVLYIIMPGGSSWTADDSSASVRSGVDNQDSLATRSNTLPAAGQNVTQGSQSLKNTANLWVPGAGGL